MKDANDGPRTQGMHPVGFLILAAWLLTGCALLVMDQPWRVLTFAFVMLGWLLSVMVHEFGHALVAYWGGDYSVKAMGYLDFDPRRYLSPGLSIGIPLLALALGGIAFPGGAVYLRPGLMRSRLWRSAASLAGPAANAALFIVLAGGLDLWPVGDVGRGLYDAVAVLAYLQAMALILNLLPIPGLDGFGAIRPFLPAAWERAMPWLQNAGMALIMLLVFVVPGASAPLFHAAAILSISVGLQPDVINAGWNAFHFWR